LINWLALGNIKILKESSKEKMTFSIIYFVACAALVSHVFSFSITSKSPSTFLKKTQLTMKLFDWKRREDDTPLPDGTI
jgi:hypothetical protein